MPIGKTNPHSRQLRVNATEAERQLWQRLRSRQLGGLKFRRQSTIGPYIVDFLCVEARLVVEADGGQHAAETDAARSAWLESRGFRILRFWNHDILGNIHGVLESILIAGRGYAPSPNPLPPAGEGY
jgi:very-short-patch-repair endonuclease